MCAADGPLLRFYRRSEALELVFRRIGDRSGAAAVTPLVWLRAQLRGLQLLRWRTGDAHAPASAFPQLIRDLVRIARQIARVTGERMRHDVAVMKVFHSRLLFQAQPDAVNVMDILRLHIGRMGSDTERGYIAIRLHDLEDDLPF